MVDITFNNLSKADGSALIDQNDTIIQATVFGPIDVAQSKTNYEEAVVDILYKSKVSIPLTSPAFDLVREIENSLKCIFKEVILTRLHPRTCISILVQEIHDGGSILSTAVNAACCALIDAGIPMRCPVAGVLVKTTNLNRFDLVFDNNFKLITVMTRGQIDEDSLKEAIVLGQNEAKIHFDTMRAKVRERFTVSKDLQQ